MTGHIFFTYNASIVPFVMICWKHRIVCEYELQNFQFWTVYYDLNRFLYFECKWSPSGICCLYSELVTHLVGLPILWLQFYCMYISNVYVLEDECVWGNGCLTVKKWEYYVWVQQSLTPSSNPGLSNSIPLRAHTYQLGHKVGRMEPKFMELEGFLKNSDYWTSSY